MKDRCVFYPKLYIGDSVKGVGLLKRRLKSGKGKIGVWCVLSAPWTNGRLAIMHSSLMGMTMSPEYPAKIYGIAASKAEAKRLVARISEDASSAGMEGRLKEFVDSRW